ncbi:hypothetical protein CSW98_01635 [Vibrio sp. HA2012]|uniref:Rha family transcriptional regulator n=1 Tax=Vibrio sp. HA2012 TaxID=1971595 RepID=UPI000C2C836D|nr:Rha family transcriptional regulator [Vibrio sp. HA2012]PJC87851.1 hypothetical protein CSW98_01635 [Vibrio sp. HA2012]
MNTTSISITSAKTSDLVFISQTNELVTDSFHVAKYFGKRHDHVLEKIKNLACTPDFTARNFAVCHKNNDLQNGKIQPFYQMTKDGFIFLVMGFTGKRAALVKEAYINAFNQMADQLNKKAAELPSPSQPLSYSTRVALTIENGHVVNSSPIPDDAFIVTKNRLCALLNEPGLFSIEEMAQLAQCSSRRLAELAQAFARLN